MDDQQIDRSEADIRARIQRDLRSIPVRPYSHYRAGAHDRMRPRRRPLGTAAALAGGVALVLLAVVIGSALSEVRRNVAASPTPGPTGPAAGAPSRPGTDPTSTSSAPSPTASESTASPVASPSPTPGPDDYAYVFTIEDAQPCTSGCRIVVRRERDGAQVFELSGVSPAVSPDGRRLAYWRTTADLGATDLRVLEVSDPRTERSVLTLSGGTIGGGVVWSNDGQGLLVVTHSREYVPGPMSHCFVESSVHMLDLTTTPPTTRSAVEPGSSACVYVPIAWDRPGQVAAAVTTGPGGYATEYVTWNGSAADPFARDEIPRLLLAFSIRASSDAKLVLGLEDDLTVLRVWPIDDITKAERLRQPARISTTILWRPGATAPYELMWVAGQKLQLLRYPGGSLTTLYTSSASLGLVAVRPDGSGVLIGEGSAGPAGPPPPTTPSTRLVVVDLATRQAADVVTIPAFGGNHRALEGGVLLR